MSAETSTYSTLSGAAGVTALVGTRIYPDVVPQEKALPAIAIARTETEFINTIHNAAPLGSFVELEIWCMAETRTGAEAVADAVKAAFIATTGFMLKNRRPEFDAEHQVYSTVLTVEFFET
jgi:hypothetical protein